VITVLREQGFRVVIYRNDHPPPHAHVFYQAGEARIDISEGQAGRPRVLSADGYGKADLRRARDLVLRTRAELLEQWTRIHG